MPNSWDVVSTEPVATVSTQPWDIVSHKPIDSDTAGLGSVAVAGIKSGALGVVDSLASLPDIAANAYDYLNTFNPLMNDADRKMYSAKKVTDFLSGAPAIHQKIKELSDAESKTTGGKRLQASTKLADDGLSHFIDTGDVSKLGDALADPALWVGGVAQAAPSLAAMWLMGGSLASAMVLEGGSEESATRNYEKRTGKKVSNEDRLSASLLAGLIGGKLEKIGFDGVTKKAGASASRAANALLAGLREGSTEVAQQANSNFATKVFVDPTQQISEGMVSGAIGGFGAGAGLGGIHAPVVVDTPQNTSIDTNKSNALLDTQDGASELANQLNDLEHPADQSQVDQQDINTQQTAEAYSDLVAQVDAVKIGRKPAMLVSDGSELPLDTDGLQAVKVENYGTLLTGQKVTKGKIAGIQILNSDGSLNGQVLGMASQVKPVDDSGMVTQALDANNNIVLEEVGQSEEAAQAAQQVAGEGGQVRVIPTEQALQEREQRRQEDLQSLNQPAASIPEEKVRRARLSRLQAEQDAQDEQLHVEAIQVAQQVVSDYEEVATDGVYQPTLEEQQQYEQAQVTIEGAQAMLSRQSEMLKGVIGGEANGQQPQQNTQEMPPHDAILYGSKDAPGDQVIADEGLKQSIGSLVGVINNEDAIAIDNRKYRKALPAPKTATVISPSGVVRGKATEADIAHANDRRREGRQSVAANDTDGSSETRFAVHGRAPINLPQGDLGHVEQPSTGKAMPEDQSDKVAIAKFDNAVKEKTPATRDKTPVKGKLSSADALTEEYKNLRDITRFKYNSNMTSKQALAKANGDSKPKLFRNMGQVVKRMEAIKKEIKALPIDSGIEQDNSSPRKLDKPITTKPVGSSQESAKPAEKPAVQEKKAAKGEVGGMLADGEIVLTSSGRETTPFPRLSLDTSRKTINTGKRVDAWLRDNAIAEAESRQDKFNLLQFQGSDVKNLSVSDKDGMEEYLFGSNQPNVMPPITHPISKSDHIVEASKKAAQPSETPKQDAVKAKQGEKASEGEAGFNSEKDDIKGKSESIKDKLKVSSNTIATEDDYEAAMKVLRDSLNQVNSGLDPKMMMAGTTVAIYHIERGVRTFAAFSKVMVQDLGDKIKPYLKMFYTSVLNHPAATELSSEMDSYDAVMRADVDVTDRTLSDALLESFNNLHKNNDLKKIIADFEGIKASEVTSKQLKEAQELLEPILVEKSREIVDKGLSNEATYQALVGLYNSQPLLNVRSSTSMKNQAYSTPAPLAFIAARLAGIDQSTNVYEPTAGNGMLLITASKNNSIVNELEDARANNLRDAGFTVTQEDASEYIPSKPFDAVITNPPFGSLRSVGKPASIKVDGYNIKSIDHLITAKALNGLPKNGKASIIIGADKESGKIGAGDRVFFNWLYSHYNVTSHFEIDGKLYNRQGAGWPIRVITVHGRKASEQVAPISGSIERVETWEQVYENFKDSMDAIGRDAGERKNSADNEQQANIEGQPSINDGEQANQSSGRSGSGRAGNSSGGTSRNSSGRNGAPNQHSGKPDVHGQHTPSTEPSQRPDTIGSKGDGASGRKGNTKGNESDHVDGVDSVSRERVLKESQDEASDFQAPYNSKSAGFNEKVLTPGSMATAIHGYLNELSSRVGNIDKYVMQKLGYTDVTEFRKSFMGLQVDSIAAVIDNIESNNQGTVIADQTGVGKGRQAAGIARYALENGKIPIFITEKANLFTDIYDDMSDIGMTDIRPMIMNSQVAIKNKTTGAEMFKDRDAKRNRKLRGIISEGKLPEDHNMLMMTYSQVTTDGHWKRGVIPALGDNVVFILDEAHNVAGERAKVKKKNGNNVRVTTGAGYMFEAIKDKPVVYLSATFAKRADNLPIYYRTALSDAVDRIDDLVTSIEAGGVPLQTVISNTLSRMGQLFRRERSFKGISIAPKIDKTNEVEQIAFSDAMGAGLQAIAKADETFNTFYFAAVKAEAEASGGSIGHAGNQASKGLDHQSFASTLHNYISQVHTAIKADSAIRNAVEAHKAGKKIVIGLSNTMQSSLKAYAEDQDVKFGDEITLTFRDLLQNALDRSRYVSKENAMGDKTRVNIPLHKLDPITRMAYDRAQKVIDELQGVDSLPISPIDYILNGLEKAGISTGEITGRDVRVDYSTGTPIFAKREDSDAKYRRGTVDSYNNGTIDALIINKAGSTGLSIHASERFKNLDGSKQKPRHMIVLQADPDINVLVQMLGRINRTGQTELPSYDILSSSLPAEIRPLAVTMGKLKKLNANTSANAESDLSFDAPDIFNRYGDEIVQEFLNDNADIAVQLNMPISDGEAAPMAGTALKFTGRAAVLPAHQLRNMLDQINASFAEYIDFLTKSGQNKLIARTLDLNARIEDSTIAYQGNGKPGFGGDAVLHKVNVKRIGKPPKGEDVTDAIDKSLDGRSADKFSHEIIDQYAEQLRLSLLELDARKAERINALDKSDEGYADEVISINRSIEAQHQKIKDTSIRTQQLVSNDFKIGKLILLTTGEGETTVAAVTNIEPKGNPYAESKWKVTLMVNSGVRRVKLPLSKLRTMSVGSAERLGSIQSIFKGEEKIETRESRHIVTGNLIAGMAAYPNGEIINFTDSKNITHQGIILPKSFSATGDATSRNIKISDPRVATKFLRGNRATLDDEGGLFNNDGLIRIKPKGHDSWEIVIPKSNREQSVKDVKFDEQLLSAMGDEFYGSSKYMRASFPDSKLRRVFSRLNEITPLYTMMANKDAYKAAGGKVRDKAVKSFDGSAPTEEHDSNEQKGLFSKGRPTTGQTVAKTEQSLIQQFGSRMKRAIEKGKVVIHRTAANAPEGVKRMTAWHGSPHDHNKFGNEHIGSGEGSQAYGWGLYFAEAKSVAEWYKDKLSKDKYFINGKEIPSNPYAIRSGFNTAYMHAVTALSKNRFDVQKTIKQELDILNEQLDDAKSRGAITSGIEYKIEAVKDLVNVRTEIKRGKLYQVELAPNEDEYLLWDEPLSEQSDKVKSAIGADRINDFETGEDFYKAQSNNGRDMEDASMSLHALGIRGIKYLDGSSRGKGEGNYNYVIFDDTDVSITAKFSKSGQIQGWYSPDGTINIVAENNDADSLAGVVLHEAKHRFDDSKQGQAILEKSIKQIEIAKTMARSGRGKVAEWITEAEAAIPSDTPAKDYYHELFAYAVQQYHDNMAALPNTIKNIVKRYVDALTGFIRAHLLKAGINVKVTPAAMASLARSELNSMGKREGVFSGETAYGSIAKEYGISEAEAKQILNEEADAPDGWYLHGMRSGGDFNDWATLGQKESSIATSYAGTDGEVYAFKPNINSITADFSDEYSSDMSKLVKAVVISLNVEMENGIAGAALELYDSIENSKESYSKSDFENDIRSSFAPIDIVNSAEAYDNNSFLNLLEYYPDGYPDFIHTPDGGLITAGASSNVDVVNITELATANTGQFNANNSDIRYSKSSPKQVRKERRKYTLELAAAVEKVSKPDNSSSFKEAITKGLNKFRKTWRQGTIDQFDSIRRTLNDPRSWMMAHLTKSATGIVDGIINYGSPEMHQNAVRMKNGSKGLAVILEPLGAEVDDFLKWIAANRAERLMTQDKEHFLSDSQIKTLKTLNQGKMEDGRSRASVYEGVRKEFEQLNADVVQMAVDNHLINAEEAAMWKEEGFYVPFYRAMEEDSGEHHGPRITNQLVRQTAYKKLKGADKPLDDLLTNVIMNWHHLVSAGLNNQAALSALNTATKMGAAHVVEEHARSKGAVFVRANGKKVWFEIDDPLVAEALTSLNYDGLNNGAMKVMRTFKRMLTIGVTASPEFKLRNLFRDTIQAIAVARMSKNGFKNIKQGYKTTKHGNKTNIDMLFGGGAFGDSGYIHGADPDAIRKLASKKGTFVSDPANFMQHIWIAYQDFGARLENVNRAANFEQSLKRGDDLLTANFEARDHLDFSRTGSWVTIRAIAQVIPFLNARMQGLDKVARAVMDENQRAQFISVVGYYSLLSIALYMFMKDDDDYKDTEDWERNSYHLIKLSRIGLPAINDGDGNEIMFRLPRPFEVGVIANMAERITEQFANDEATGKDFGEALLFTVEQTLAIDLRPQLFKPAMEVYANKNAFTGRPIESLGMTYKPVTERAKPWTSETAQVASKAMNILGDKATLSPVQIQHLVRGYFGWMGTSILGATDMLLTRRLLDTPKKPDWRMDEYPVIKAFMEQTPKRHIKQASIFYDNMQEVNSAFRSIKRYRKDGNRTAIDGVLEDHGEQLKYRKQYNRSAKRISQINKQIEVIYKSRTMRGDIKQKKITGLNEIKNTIYQSMVDRSSSAFK